MYPMCNVTRTEQRLIVRKMVMECVCANQIETFCTVTKDIIDVCALKNLNRDQDKSHR